MKKYLVLFLIFVISLTIVIEQKTSAHEETILVADFNSGEKPNSLGEDFGTWNKDTNDKTQGCQMSFVKDDALGKPDGNSVRLDYDVDSPNPAYNGFWMKLNNVAIDSFDTLSFYVKGDSEKRFSSKIKVEVKDKKGGKEVFTLDGITEKWQKFSVPLKFDKAQIKPFSEFTIVFDDINSNPKHGAIMIDQIIFSNASNKQD